MVFLDFLIRQIHEVNENNIDVLIEKVVNDQSVYETLNYELYVDKNSKNSFSFEELKQKLNKGVKDENSA